MNSAFERLQKLAEEKRLKNKDGHPKPEISASEASETAEKNLGAQNTNLGAQIEKFGRPKKMDQQNRASKNKIWAPKSEIWAPKKNRLGAQISDKKGQWSTYDSHRKTERVNLRPDAEILNKFKEFCVERGFTLTEFFELAGNKLIDLGAQKKNNFEIWAPIDRKKILYYQSSLCIINLFHAYQKIFHKKTEWKAKDDAVGVKYDNTDPRIIEIGIIQTQGNILENEADTKPERFKYYTREIDKFSALGYSEEMLDIILATNRKRWQELTGKELDLSFLEENKIE